MCVCLEALLRLQEALLDKRQVPQVQRGPYKASEEDIIDLGTLLSSPVFCRQVHKEGPAEQGIPFNSQLKMSN